MDAKSPDITYLLCDLCLNLTLIKVSLWRARRGKQADDCTANLYNFPRSAVEAALNRGFLQIIQIILYPSVRMFWQNFLVIALLPQPPQQQFNMWHHDKLRGCKIRSHLKPCGTLSIVPVCHMALGVIELLSTSISYRKHRHATRSLISIVANAFPRHMRAP